MLLYHYSTQRYDELLCLRLQKKLSQKEIEEGVRAAKYRCEPQPYYNHISFFIEPAPLDIIGDLFRRVNHHIWVNDKTVYEHMVDSCDLEPFVYTFVETPFDTKYVADNWPDEPTDDLEQAYFRARYNERKRLGQIGTGNTELEKHAKRFLRTTRAAFIEATTHPFDDESLQLYAAGVPHLMIYPERGKVTPVATNIVTIGEKKKRPKSLEW